MALHVDSLAIDARDPEAMARWWQQVLGGEVVREQGTVPRLVGVAGSPPIDFLLVDEPPVGKNRLHLDLRGRDQAAEVARLRALGATPADVGQGPDATWVVLADPEGNVLCVLSSNERAETVAVANLAVDARDPEALARWWQQVLGGRVDDDEDDEEVVCLDGAAGAPHLDFVRVADPKVGKNRLHLDLRPDDQAAEVARLEALGATRVEERSNAFGQTWVVMRDPEGNGFCVS